MSETIAVATNIPAPQFQFVGADGRLTQEAYIFLLRIYNRTGQAPGVNAAELQADIEELQVFGTATDDSTPFLRKPIDEAVRAALMFSGPTAQPVDETSLILAADAMASSPALKETDDPWLVGLCVSSIAYVAP